MKTFKCASGTYDIDEVMNGQTDLIYQDTLGMAFAKPDLRDGTILCYNHTGIEGLTSQLQSFFKSDTRMVSTNPYWWTEKCEDENISITILANPTPGVAGAPVTVTVDKGSHSRGGRFSKALEDRRGYINELNVQVNVTSVNRSVNDAFTVTLTPLNNRVLDLSGLEYYTLVIDPLRMYKKGDTQCIQTEGYVGSLPLLRKGWIQGFEKGIEIHQDELNGYAYDREFKLGVGWNSRTQSYHETWSIQHISDQLLENWMDSRNIETLVGERDDVTGQGFDGIITTADAQGMFTNLYDPNDGVSFMQRIMNMVKSMRKVNGCKDYLFAYDFGFMIDWSTQLMNLVTQTNAAGGAHNYSLFGLGNAGARNVIWPEFHDFSLYGYNFRGYQIDAFDSARYGYMLKDFAYIQPACTFTDSKGRTVPPITYVNIERDERAPEKKMWSYDFRQEGCRTVKVFIQDFYGMENHCSTKTATWRKEEC